MAGELSLVELIELGIEFCGTYTLPVKGESGNENKGETCGNNDGKAGGAVGGNSRGETERESGGGFGVANSQIISNDKGVNCESVSGNEPIDYYINEFGNICYRRPGGKSGVATVGDSGIVAGDESGNGNGDISVVESLYNHPPLTSVKALKFFLSRMEGVNGRKKAERALRYISDWSASPMETIVFMLLTLPYKHGGYGLPKPEFNKRIDIRKIAKQRPDKTFYKCDLFWPKENLAIEYDSDLHHTGPERIEGDSIKRLDLKALGIEVVTVTRGQVQNTEEFESVAKSIAKSLGKRLWFKEPGFKKARNELHDFLLRAHK